MKRPTSIPVIFAALTLLYTGIGLTSCENNAPEKQTNGSIPARAGNIPDTVTVFLLHDTSVTKDLELTAELLPFQQATLQARVQGYVKEMKVDIGDKVHRGQTVALIEAPELQTRYAEFQSALQTAKAKYRSSMDVFQRLNKASQAKTPGIVAPVDLERSRNQLVADSASFEAAQNLAQTYKQTAGYLVLQSPFDGIVTARNADRGVLVGTNQAILTVQDHRTLRLRIAIPESFTGAASGKEARFRTDAYPGKTFPVTLSRKSGSIDPVTRTELWEYLFDNRSGDCKAGSFAYVKLHLARPGNSFIVQPAAIVTNQERRFVIRIKKGKTEWVDVRQGMSTDRGIEIFGDLGNGDTLVNRDTDERKPGSTAYWKIKP